MAKKAASAEVPASLKSNSEVVRELLAEGITKPADIVQAALDKHGVTVNKGLVNAVKSVWNKKQGGSKVTKLNKAPKKKAAAPAIAKSGGSGSVSHGRPTELDVAKFALKMGGVDAAIEALKNLVK